MSLTSEKMVTFICVGALTELLVYSPFSGEFNCVDRVLFKVAPYLEWLDALLAADFLEKLF